MSSPESQIANAEALTSVFGYWPSFHDAEVIGVSLSRAFGSDHGPALMAKIHVFEMTNEVAPSGHFVCHKHSIVELRFRNIEGIELDGFNHQNALSGLSIEHSSEDQSRARFTVLFENAYGIDCKLKCQQIEVMSVESGIPTNSVYSR